MTIGEAIQLEKTENMLTVRAAPEWVEEGYISIHKVWFI